MPSDINPNDNVIVLCPNGCSNGSCIESVSSCDENENVCTATIFEGETVIVRSNRVSIDFISSDSVVLNINGDRKGTQKEEGYYTFSNGDKIVIKKIYNPRYVGDPLGGISYVEIELIKSTESLDCIDSDGGLDYYVKGTASKKDWTTITDFCVNSTTLSETICNSVGNPTYAKYYCPEGCNRDVCIRTIVCEAGQKLGDIDGDGEITRDDQAIVGLILVNRIPEPEDISCIDVNEDGVVSSEDSRLIGQYADGDINSFEGAYQCPTISRRGFLKRCWSNCTGQIQDEPTCKYGRVRLWPLFTCPKEGRNAVTAECELIERDEELENEETLRETIKNEYEKEFSYEACVLDEAEEYTSAEDCGDAWNCLAREYASLIPRADLQELADCMIERGGESCAIEYEEENPSLNIDEQLADKFDICLAGRHVDYS